MSLLVRRENTVGRDGGAEPLVSVILPTYNRLRYLGGALESVRTQTYEHWELVVVDDGSTDGSGEYLARLVDRRVRLLSRSHTGSAAVARNSGIAMARGEYLAFLDDDDAWMPQKLERQMAALREDRAVQWNYTGYILVDADGRETRRRAGGPWTPYSG